jgi:hypothetical protein
MGELIQDNYIYLIECGLGKYWAEEGEIILEQ